jgi:hypothetical protein
MRRRYEVRDDYRGYFRDSLRTVQTELVTGYSDQRKRTSQQCSVNEYPVTLICTSGMETCIAAVSSRLDVIAGWTRRVDIDSYAPRILSNSLLTRALWITACNLKTDNLVPGC